MTEESQITNTLELLRKPEPQPEKHPAQMNELDKRELAQEQDNKLLKDERER